MGDRWLPAAQQVTILRVESSIHVSRLQSPIEYTFSNKENAQTVDSSVPSSVLGTAKIGAIFGGIRRSQSTMCDATRSPPEGGRVLINWLIFPHFSVVARRSSRESTASSRRSRRWRVRLVFSSVSWR